MMLKNFRKDIKQLNYHKKINKSIYLSLVLLFCLIVSITFKTSHAVNISENKEIVIDPATNTKYKNIISENNIGSVWVDKSVFANDITLDNTTIKKNVDEDFLVSLSATSLGIDLNLKESNVKDIVIVQDASNSMKDNKVGSITRLQASKNAINELLETIAKANDNLSSDEEKFKLAVVTFNIKGSEKVIFDLSEVNTTNLSELQTKVNGITTKGDTYISTGLNLALNQIQTNGRENVDSSIITFMDGEPYPASDGQVSINIAHSLKNDHKIVMYSVIMNSNAKGGTTTNIDKIGQALSSNYDGATSKEELGEKTGNTYYYIPKTADDLINAFKDIIKTIQRKGYALEKGSNLIFTDKLGNYMEVNKIKGLSYNGTVYTYVSESTSGNIKKYTYSNAVNDIFNKASSLSNIIIEVTKSENIEDGDLIKVIIPSNLVPMSMYNVTSKFLTDRTVYTTTLQEKKPITLVYSSNIKEEVYELYRNYDTKLIEYIKRNGKIEDNIARVKFYSNYYQMSENGTTEVSYKPYSMNNKYFYEDESYLYVKNGSEYIKYNGETLSSNIYYVKHKVYKVGTELPVEEKYTVVNDTTKAIKDSGNYWYLNGVNKKIVDSTMLKEKNETHTSVNLEDTNWNNLEIKSYLGNNGIVTVEMDVERTSIGVEKRWEDNEDFNEKRPKSIRVRLKGNEEFLVGKEVELSEENDWSYTFSNLPSKVDGKKIKYTVFEEEVENYKANIVGSEEKGYLITNTYVPEAYVPPEEDNPITGFKAAIIAIVLSVILIFICFYFKDKRNRIYKL